ncbi:hypothetical protein [Lysobacter capsici]|uniref:hypothetical protein n=1 Tax=Lysobacter capsici TaxID=435897 RepID=UPI00398D5F9F
MASPPGDGQRLIAPLAIAMPIIAIHDLLDPIRAVAWISRRLFCSFGAGTRRRGI